MRLAFLAFVPFVSVFAQPFPDAAKLLSQGAETLGRYHSYEYTTDMTIDMGAAMPFPIVSSMLTRAVNPGRLRMEARASGMDTMLIVADGEHVWSYIPFMKQYTKADGSEGTKSLTDEMAGIPDSSKLTSNARVIRSEVLEVDGQQHDCWVVESRIDKLPGQSGAGMQDVLSTQWIDKTLGLALQTTMSGKSTDGTRPPMQIKMKTNLHSFKFNQDLPDSLFVFTPPADAKETKELMPGAAAAPAPAPGPVVSTVASNPPQAGEPQAFILMLNPIERSEPEYPAAAHSQHLQGMVNLLVTIDPEGHVVTAEPLTGREALRPAAIDAVQKWQYRPVLRNGHPVSAYTEAMVDFIIDPKNPPTTLEEMGLDVSEQVAQGQRIRELQEKFPRSPEQVVLDTEQQNSGGSEMERFYVLPELAKKSVEAGALDKAASYANELLQTAPKHRDDWNYGNAIHDGNMVLGLVALRQGSVANAKQYLLESAKISGSPQLDSFGPDLTLARELLKEGERDTVLEYFSLCGAFWKMGAAKLDAMTEAVRNGGTF